MQRWHIGRDGIPDASAFLAISLEARQSAPHPELGASRISQTAALRKSQGRLIDGNGGAKRSFATRSSSGGLWPTAVMVVVAPASAFRGRLCHAAVPEPLCAGNLRRACAPRYSPVSVQTQQLKITLPRTALSATCTFELEHGHSAPQKPRSQA